MAVSKTLILIGLALAFVLLIASEVSARELGQETGGYGEGRGEYGGGYGKGKGGYGGGYGKGKGEHGGGYGKGKGGFGVGYNKGRSGYNKPAHGKYPPATEGETHN